MLVLTPGGSMPIAYQPISALEPNNRTRLVWNLKRVSNIGARLIWIVRTNIDAHTNWYVQRLIPTQHCNVSSWELCPNEILFLEGKSRWSTCPYCWQNNQARNQPSPLLVLEFGNGVKVNSLFQVWRFCVHWVRALGWWAFPN